MLGAVGQLQFEVFKHRMENEYNAEVVMSPMGKKDCSLDQTRRLR